MLIRVSQPPIVLSHRCVGLGTAAEAGASSMPRSIAVLLLGVAASVSAKACEGENLAKDAPLRSMHTHMNTSWA